MATLSGVSTTGAVGSLTVAISIDIGISRFLLEDGSGYLLLEDGSYLMEEAGTGPIPSINGATGSVTQSKQSALSGVVSTGNAGSVAPSIDVTVDNGWGVDAWGTGGWGSPRNATSALVGTSAPDTRVSAIPVVSTGAAATIAPDIQKGINGVSELSSISAVTSSISVAGIGVSAVGDTGNNPSDRTESLSGIAASGNAGTVAPAIEVSIVPGWGIGAWGAGAWGANSAITGAVGSNGVAVQVASTGNAADGQAGTVIYNRIEFITGLQGFGAIGGLTPSTTVTIGISRFLLEDDSGFLLLEDGSYLMEEAGTGPIPSINGAVGSVVQSYAYSLTGIEAAANVGAVVPSTTVSIVPGSWGLGAWGANVWGGVQPTIVGSAGSVVYSPTLTGVQASGSVGQMTPSITVDIGISRFLLENTGWGADTWGNGAWGSSNIGYLLLEDGSYLMEEAGTGPIPSINGAVGDVNHTKEITLTSDLAIGAVNEMIAESPALRGVHADGFAGTPVSNVTVAITGVATQGAAGYLAAVQAALLSGIVATGSVGVIGVVKSYWDIIDDAQDANWVEIANAQTAAWAAISNAQTAGWDVIPNAQSPGWGPANISGWGANAWGFAAWGETQDAGWELIPTAFDEN